MRQHLYRPVGCLKARQYHHSLKAGFRNEPAFFLVNLVPLCYYRPMRRLNPKIILPLFVLLFLSIPLFSQSADFQIAWVKRVIDGHTLLLFGGERVRLIGVDTPEVNESKNSAGMPKDRERMLRP